ncbi:ATP-binding protein [Streptomyces sp. NPDC006193]|uniref:ATP-binding protein n=1 Tax=Streptomyces sp. NPDC006193 TaxID=3155717 RepID=UPI0033B4FD42
MPLPQEAADAVAGFCRIPDGGQRPHRPPVPAGDPAPAGGERAGRLPGPDGLARLASGAVPPGTAAPARPAPDHRTAAFEVPALPSAVGAARRTVRGLLTDWGVPDGVRDDVLLVVSELVTNALVHAAGERIGCRLHGAGGRVRIEVEDQAGGPTLPAARRAGPDDRNGRGLFLVEALSLDWGVRPVPGRSARVVWAELPSGHG